MHNFQIVLPMSIFFLRCHVPETEDQSKNRGKYNKFHYLILVNSVGAGLPSPYSSINAVKFHLKPPSDLIDPHTEIPLSTGEAEVVAPGNVDCHDGE